jgi:hypothetical protein
MTDFLCPVNDKREIRHDGTHDVGGLLSEDLKGFGKIDVTDKKLQLWELQIHALLVVLANHKPSLITTDELRRAVEGLEPQAYINWGYYEKWGAAITAILLERHVITQRELDDALCGDEESSKMLLEAIPTKFKVGDLVRVKKEDTRLRWREFIS